MTKQKNYSIIKENNNENILNNLIDNLLKDKNIRGFSQKWANRMSELTLKTCETCREEHGKIEDISILSGSFQKPVNEHFRCACFWVRMRTKQAGTATKMGTDGADFLLFHLNQLPDYYITKKEARKKGWKDYKGNLNDVLPGKMIGGDIYKNYSNKLPDKAGRIWYEADINYDGGTRNRQRVLYSNDGLIFVTYDHYETFHEITG